MVTNEFKNYAEAAIIHTYNRFPVAFDHGDGVYLYDTDGRRYLDFAAGIAVNAFGYNVEEYKDALKAQIDKLMHVSNLYYTEPMAKAAHKLAEASGLKRVFFTNSGTEAIEGAIKVARKYAFKKDGTTDHEIIAMEHSFHGRSMGALSVTGNAHYREAVSYTHLDVYKRQPWSDDLNVRSQSFDTELKTDLVISFTCSAVADGGSIFFTCDFYKSFCDYRTGHGCTEKVLVFVNSAGLYTRNDIFIAEFINNIFDI